MADKLDSKPFPDQGKDGKFGIIAETGKIEGLIKPFGSGKALPPIIVKFYPSCNCIAGPADRAPDYCPTHGVPPLEIINTK